MRKTAPMLGMIQHMAVRRKDSRGRKGDFECVALHCPSQILPKQNAGTILSRIRRWGVYTSSGCPPAYGGQELYDEFANIPLKMLMWCAGLSFCR